MRKSAIFFKIKLKNIIYKLDIYTKKYIINSISIGYVCKAY